MSKPPRKVITSWYDKLFVCGFCHGCGLDLKGKKFLLAVNRRLDCDYVAVNLYQTDSNSQSRKKNIALVKKEKRLCSGRGGILLGSRLGT